MRWTNIPIPEAHLAALIAAIGLHLAIPVRLHPNRWLRRLLGWAALAAGVLLVGWAVAAAGEVEIEEPNALISTGPYALSRNPMYLAWTLLMIGAELLVNTAWMLVCLPAALVATHRTIQQEEQQLERRFDETYRWYKARVRRYI